MTTAAQVDTDTSCVICKDIFTDPRVLPCGHTFCHNCLNAHINKTIRGGTFRCPFCRRPATVKRSSQQQTSESMARQFPVNYPLVQTIDLIKKLQIQNVRTQLRTIHERLHMSCQMAEQNLDQEVDLQLQNLDLKVAEIAANIDNTADKMIQQFTGVIQTKQEALHKQLAVYHETARTNTKARFNQIKTRLTSPKHCLESSKHMLNDEATSELEIKDNIKAIEVEQKHLKDYFETHEVEGSSNKIIFTKSDKTTEIGTLNLTDAHVPSAAATEPRHTLRQIHRENDNLQLIKVINTCHSSQTWHPILTSIAIVHVQELPIILVADNNNHYIKSYKDNGTLHSIYKTYGIPSGLAKFRDNQVVVTLPPQSEILFLEVDDKRIVLIKRVKTNKIYDKVSVLPNFSLAVTPHEDCEVLDIIDQDGNVMWSAPHIDAHCPSCHLSTNILVSANCFLIVSNYEPLKCMSTSGDIKWFADVSTSHDSKSGVTCDSLGFIYMANYYDNSILQLSPSGKFLRIIITKQDTSNPRAVCFDHDQLYVTQEDGEIRIYAWE